ncbi:hypothetical protein D3C79_1024120 [compost metagenome]
MTHTVAFRAGQPCGMGDVQRVKQMLLGIAERIQSGKFAEYDRDEMGITAAVLETADIFGIYG